jgi:hypothetical protein
VRTEFFGVSEVTAGRKSNDRLGVLRWNSRHPRTIALEPLTSPHGLRGFAHLIESLAQKHQDPVESHAVSDCSDSLGTKDSLASQKLVQAEATLPATSRRVFVLPSDNKSPTATRKSGR